MARQEITSGTTKQFLEKINQNFEELYGSKETVDNIPDITFGNSPPDNTIGEEGDIYIQYE